MSPPGACARTTKTSLMGEEQNHFWPVSRYVSPDSTAPPGSGAATVVVVRRSLPACRSVTASPARLPSFSAGGRRLDSYARDANRGSQTFSRSGSARSPGTAA